MSSSWLRCSLYVRGGRGIEALCCAQGIEKMRNACRLAADVLDMAGQLVKVSFGCLIMFHLVAVVTGRLLT